MVMALKYGARGHEFNPTVSKFFFDFMEWFDETVWQRRLEMERKTDIMSKKRTLKTNIKIEEKG